MAHFFLLFWEKVIFSILEPSPIHQKKKRQKCDFQPFDFPSCSTPRPPALRPKCGPSAAILSRKNVPFHMTTLMAYPPAPFWLSGVRKEQQYLVRKGLPKDLHGATVGHGDAVNLRPIHLREGEGVWHQSKKPCQNVRQPLVKACRATRAASTQDNQPGFKPQRGPAWCWLGGGVQGGRAGGPTPLRGTF